MLSIIICHRNPIQLAAVEASIAKTVGVPYELIILDNTQNQYTIFSAYNEGVRRSHYSICCFSHEDVTYHTVDWGQKVLAHFEDSATGMIGVTGARLIPTAPSAWWYNLHDGHAAVSLIESRNRPEPDYHYLNPLGEQLKTQVVLADGLWFCIRRSLFEEGKVCFDEETFSSFHLYDADISMQVGQHAKLYVVYDILLRHYSHGNTQQDYYTTLITFARKWLPHLPVHASHITRKEAERAGWYHLRRFLLDAKASGFSKQQLAYVRQEFLLQLRRGSTPLWHHMYFILARLTGQRLANAIFERIEKLRPTAASKAVQIRPAENLSGTPRFKESTQ